MPRTRHNVAAAVKPNTKLLYLETPGNPTLALCDLDAIARVAKAAGVVTICDNTFATPINQRPLDLGIDVVVHSATKYFCGHGDAVGGLVAGGRPFIERAATEPMRYFGGIMSPFVAYLILRGTQTLPLRVERHNANAQTVAEFLEQHPAVASVSYPGLASHPQHDLARKQMRGFGGMVCFDLRGGVAAGTQLMNTVKICSLAVSLGDTRTLITHPASTTHSVISREARLVAGRHRRPGAAVGRARGCRGSDCRPRGGTVGGLDRTACHERPEAVARPKHAPARA